MQLELNGKNILVTGVSRSMGIGAEIARTLARNGANVIIHGHSGYDEKLDYVDADHGFADELISAAREEGHSIQKVPSSDLSLSNESEKVVKLASEMCGYVDGMVLNHAYSTYAPIGEWTEENIKSHLDVNVAASMMMIQAFAKLLPADKMGAITLFTSGQYLGPMINEIAYAVSKDAIIGLCKQTAAALAPKNIRVNCVNPGPTDTGYLFGEDYKKVAKLFPSERWGMPADIAKLVHFLQSDYSSWITGEIIASEGGFNRYIT